MANFPTVIDTFVTPLPANYRNAPSLAGQMTDKNMAILSLEAKVGVDGSAVTTSHDYKLSAVTGTEKAITPTTNDTFKNKNLTDASNTFPTLNQDTTGYSGALKTATTTVNVSASPAPAPGQILVATNGTAATWQTPALALAILLPATASEDLTIGQPVGISNLRDEYVARAKRTYDTIAHNIPNVTSNGINPNLYFPIGGDKFVYLSVSSDGADTLYAQVGEIDPTTLSLNLGTPSAAAAAITPKSVSSENICGCKLNTDKFVVFYLLDTSSTVIKYRVGTVSGTTIAWGLENTASTAGSTVATSLCFTADQLGTDKGVFVYKAATTANSKMIVFTCSTTTLTFGAEVTPGTQSRKNNVSVVKNIGTDKFVLVTEDATNSIYGQVCTVATRTITDGNEQQISTVNNDISLKLSVISPETDKFVVRSYVGSTKINLVSCTVSTRTITAGTPLTTTTIVPSASNGIYPVSTTNFYIPSGISGNDSAIYEFSLAGNVWTYEKIVVQQFCSFSSNLLGFVNMDNGYMILCSYDATDMIIWIQGMANNFIGTAQATISSGDAVSVLVKGIDTNQTGLTPGDTYLVDKGVLNFVSSTVTVNTLYDIDTVKALSATKILV